VDLAACEYGATRGEGIEPGCREVTVNWAAGRRVQAVRSGGSKEGSTKPVGHVYCYG
jgi:hypothetical protein